MESPDHSSKFRTKERKMQTPRRQPGPQNWQNLRQQQKKQVKEYLDGLQNCLCVHMDVYKAVNCQSRQLIVTVQPGYNCSV